MPSLEGLREKQALSLRDKIRLTELRIEEVYEKFDGKVYVGFSGGMDSTMVLHIARSMYPEIPAVFQNTGLEYPEILQFVKSTENVTWLRPKMSFTEVIEKYGWPVVSKDNARKVRQFTRTKSPYLACRRYFGNYPGDNAKLANKWRKLLYAPFKISDQCCEVMKRRPAAKYEKVTGRVPILGIRTAESSGRKNRYRLSGCNNLNGKRPVSNPISFWTSRDIQEYQKLYNVPYSKIYDKGYSRTGCIFCAFGLELEYKKTGTTRFILLKKTHPKLWKYCMDTLGLRDVLHYVYGDNSSTYIGQ